MAPPAAAGERQTVGPGGSHPTASSSAAGPLTVEDVTPEMIGKEPNDDISSLQLDVNGVDVETLLCKSKHELIEMEKLHVSECFRKQRVDVTDKQVEQIAVMSVEIGSSHLIELFSPKRFNAYASKMGLRPGFSVDLCEEKPYGPNAGQCWDLSKDADVEELEQLVDYEKPELLTGSPPCDAFSLLQNLSKSFRNEARRELKLAEGRRYLHTAIKFYRKQLNAKRYFLHEHPLGCASWQDSEMVALQREDGVYTVTSPMCCYGMKVGRSGREEMLANKPTKYVTNSRVIAQALDRWCSNKLGITPFHQHVELVGGIAHFAAAYPPELVKTVLRALRQQLVEDGSISELELKTSGPVPSESIHKHFPDEVLQDAVRYYDDISGEELPPDLVEAGKQEELKWIRSIGLYDKVDRSSISGKGGQVIPTRWVYVNKGDSEKYNVRCRLVAKELKAKTREALLAHELFSATPPWELIKVLFSLLVSDGPHRCGEDLEIGVYDISRAHFIPLAMRDLFIELPDVDRVDGEDKVGHLRRTMYGCRDASHGWMLDWQQLLADNGYRVGKSNPALFFNPESNARGAVHGDDFVVCGPRKALDAMNSLLKSKYSVRESHRLGFGPGCAREATILNRVVTLGLDDGGRKYVKFEADKRHVDLILQSCGLGNSSNHVNTPAVKQTDVQAEQLQLSAELSPKQATAYRSAVMRASFLSQDRPDLGEGVKRLAQGMSKPRVAHQELLKRFARYLAGRPSMAVVFRQQTLPDHIRISVDSDFAGCKVTRRSTTGAVQRLGMHCLKTTSNLQTSVGLNVAETEYYALCHGAAHGLGLKAHLEDLNLPLRLILESDSNSARSFASRLGLGRQRHVQTRYLWLQDAVSAKRLDIKRVGTNSNVSDILTKPCDATTLEKHLKTLGVEVVSASRLHKRLSGSTGSTT